MPSPIEKLLDEWVAQNPKEHLPGEGKPLDLEENFRWPEDKRMEYSLLRSAGCVPPEVDLLQQIASLKPLIHRSTNPTSCSLMPALSSAATLPWLLANPTSRSVSPNSTL